MHKYKKRTIALVIGLTGLTGCGIAPYNPAKSSCGEGGYNNLWTGERNVYGECFCSNGYKYDTRKKVCVGSTYREEDGGCFLTTACVNNIGLEDGCFELTVLRNFRDSYMLKNSERAKMVDEYYRKAPEIISRIPSAQKAVELNRIYAKYIIPCVVFASLKMNKSAEKHYIKLMKDLTSRYGMNA